MEKLLFIDKNSDRKEYSNVLKYDLAHHICPLCPNGLHDSRRLKSLRGWNLVFNEFPYAHTRVHLLIIPEAHKLNFIDLTADDMNAVRELTDWAIEKFQIVGGGLALRFGKLEYSGASVHHLHFHVIAPEVDEKNDLSRVVWFGVGREEEEKKGKVGKLEAGGGKQKAKSRKQNVGGGKKKTGGK